MKAGWRFAHSPFHPGEQRLQTQVGAREEVEGRGRRVIRDYLPQQHREFYAGLSYLLLAAVDAEGHPRIAFAWGEPGFAHSSEPGLLRICCGPWLSPAFEALLRPGASLGAMGIDLGSRRRNRVNGRLLSLDEAGLTLAVAQSFGNCPKYIQRRQPLPRSQGDGGDDYSAAAMDALIDGADTFLSPPPSAARLPP